jgi:hypothetical protein
VSVARETSWRDLIGPGLALFGSSATLICCALPALLVSLGMGAAVAGLISAAPQITALSAYKGYVFAGSGLVILAAGFLQWQARNAPCPADPRAAAACMRLRLISRVVMAIAAAAWAIGFFFAFFAADLFFPEP